MTRLPDDSNHEANHDDVLLRHTVKEAKGIVLIWLVMFVWVVGYCRLYAYDLPEGPIPTTLGMPSWTFWGIAVPWVVATLITCWYALARIADEPLESSPDEGDDGDG